MGPKWDIFVSNLLSRPQNFLRSRMPPMHIRQQFLKHKSNGLSCIIPPNCLFNAKCVKIWINKTTDLKLMDMFPLFTKTSSAYEIT